MDPPGHAAPTFGAAYRFAHSPDLVFCLTDVITSKRELAVLRLVNGLFHAAATPKVFRSFRIANLLDHDRLLAANHVLGVIKSIAVTRAFHVGSDNSGISAALLKQLPSLEAFRSTTLIPAATCLDLRRACPKLKSLDLDFRGASLDIHCPDYRMPLAELSQFEGLRELSLSTLNDSESPAEWARHIAGMLSKSPRLKRLSVGLCGKVYFHGNWFDMLCNEYGQTGAAPLALQALQCYPGNFTEKCPSFYKMVDLQALEDVRFDSGNPVNLFLAVINDAPNLRRFSLSVYLPEMHVELCRAADLARIQKVAIFFKQLNFGPEVASLLFPSDNGMFPASSLQPRMMQIDLDRDWVRRKAKDRRCGTAERAFSNLGAAEVLQLLVSGPGRDVLEGLLVHFPPSKSPATLSNAVKAVKGVLPSLRKLSQLRVVTENGHQRRQMTELALQFAKASRHLRYISVGYYRWRIIGHEDLEMTQLEELDDEEGLEVELFGLTREM